jgi:hypothetical protein
MSAAQRRLNHLQSILQENVIDESLLSENLQISNTASFKQSDDDVVIIYAVRTPIGKAKRGVFKDTHPTDLLVSFQKEINVVILMHFFLK